MTAIPFQSVAFRDGAVTTADMVTVLDECASKTNAKADPAVAGSGLDLETMLSLKAWVRDLGDVKHAWVDLHVFDADDQLIRSETLPLYHLRAVDDGDEYGFEGSVYRGTGASPGSVWLAPDARKVQFRLYYEAEGTVFSDGLLRQHEVPADSLVANPHVAPPRRRRAATSK